LRRSLIELGFERIESDQCIYIKASQDSFILIGIYVDDILLAARNHQEAEEISKMLGNKMTNLGPAKRFLGVDIIQNPNHGRIFIHQESYLNILLEKFGWINAPQK
jgi:Reverse transcriptase (RNA-dependent DNA polymerase)